MNNGRSYDQPTSYIIRIKGSLDSTWSDWFGGLAKNNELGLPIVSIDIKPDLKGRNNG